MLTRRRALLGLTFFVASCSTGTAAFRPPVWHKVRATALPATNIQRLAGWNGGYLLVAAQPTSVWSSADGRRWRTVTPPGLTLTPPTSTSRMTAGYGSAAYVAGWKGGNLVVWRTADGERWQETPLDVGGLTYHDGLHMEVNIVAGARGVIVIANDVVAPPSFQGFYVWRSADQGRTFGKVVRVPMRQDKPSDNISIDAMAATARGFLVSGSGEQGVVILSSPDGSHWASISSPAQLAHISVAQPIAANASDAVVFNGDVKADKPLAMYRRGGTWHPAAVDPGHLPDEAVVPASQRILSVACAWGTGFIAAGYVVNGTQFAGMTWYSADGSRWTRQSVHSNGFGVVGEFMDAAVSNGKAMLIAFPAEGSDLLFWQSTPA